jgi:hypothetical protein
VCGVAGLCVGWSGAEASATNCALAGRGLLSSNSSFSPLDYKYPFTYLERIRLPFKSHLCLHSLSPPLLSSQSYRISHSTHPNSNPFGRKIEETLIYISTKPNLITPCVHRVLLVTIGFVGNPRRLGSPGGIQLVIRPVESL